MDHRGPLNWINPQLVGQVHEARLAYVANMSTLELIAQVITDEDDRVAWMMALTEIMALPTRKISMDDALGQGRN